MSGGNETNIGKASSEDISAMKSLADAHRFELGFVRRPALISAIDRGEALVGRRSQEVVGFVLYRHCLDGETAVYDIAVQTAHRRQGVGRALLEALRVEARSLGQRTIRAKCPLDLPANRFYEQLGYKLESQEPGKRRPLAVWSLGI